jgi:hypothetical protein
MATTTASAANEEWLVLKTFLPPDWRTLAVDTNALKGLRQDKSEENLLRTLLMHVGCGYSLRETAVRAQESGLANLSDVALLKRLRKSQDWFYEMCIRLFRERGLDLPKKRPSSLRLIDATTVKEPGKTGGLWRVHYSVQIPSLRCDFFKVTGTEGPGTGEGFWQIPVQRGDHLIADRGYSNMEGICKVCAAGARILVRLNQQAVRLEASTGRDFALLGKLRTLQRAGQVGEWDVELVTLQGRVRGRVCAVRKSEAAIRRAQKQLRRRASKKSQELQPETLEYAKYVVVFTTFLPEQYSAVEVLDWYRVRWQVELVFKRFKQIARLGHLPKHEDESAKAWLYGKLLVALLTEKLISQARALSPWGYALEGETTAQSLA